MRRPHVVLLLLAALLLAAPAAHAAAFAGRAHARRPLSARVRALMAQAALLETEAEAQAGESGDLDSTAMGDPAGSGSSSAAAAGDEGSDSAGGSDDDDESSGAGSTSAGPDDDGGTNVVLANSNSIDNFDDGSRQKQLQEQSKKRIKREQQTKQATYDYVSKTQEADQKAAQKQLEEMKQKSEADLKFKEKQHKDSLQEQQDKAKQAQDEQTAKAEQKLLEEKEKEAARVAAEAASKAEQQAKAAEKEKEEKTKVAETAEKKDAEENKKAEAVQKEKEAKAAKEAEQRNKATPLPLADSVSNYGDVYDTASFVAWGNLIVVSGLVRAWNGHIGTLPPGSRPNGGRLIFTTVRGGTNCRVDVLDDGRIYYITGLVGTDWMSISGITFEANVQSGMNLVWGWISYGYGYRGVSQNRINDLCLASGLIRNGNWGYFGYVRDDCRPNGRLIFSGNNHERITRVDLLSNGYFVYSGGYTNNGWISFDGMVWVPNGGNALTLYNGWSNYGGEYRGATYLRTGRVCSVGGLINNGNGWANHIATLPEGCRPRARLVFGGNVHIADARVDILPTGEIVYVSHKASWDWLSLSGIHFIAHN